MSAGLDEEQILYFTRRYIHCVECKGWDEFYDGIQRPLRTVTGKVRGQAEPNGITLAGRSHHGRKCSRRVTIVHLADLPGWLEFTEDDIERAAEGLWKHRPMERAWDGTPKLFESIPGYMRARYRGMARAVVAALRGGAA